MTHPKVPPLPQNEIFNHSQHQAPLTVLYATQQYNQRSKSPITPQQQDQKSTCNRDSDSDFLYQPKLLSSPVAEESPSSHRQQKLKKVVAEFIEKAVEEENTTKRSRTRSSNGCSSEYKKKMSKVRHRVDCWNTPAIQASLEASQTLTLTNSKKMMRNGPLARSVAALSQSLLPLTKDENSALHSSKKERLQPSARYSVQGDCKRCQSKRSDAGESLERASNRLRCVSSGVKVH